MRTAVIDGGGEILHGPEVERAMADQFDFVVHAFQDFVRDPEPGSRPGGRRDECAAYGRGP